MNKIFRKIKEFFTNYFEITKKISIWPPELPIKFKFHKFYEKNKIITIIIIIVIIILALYGSVEIIEKIKPKPHLKFNNIIFKYFDSEKKEIGISRDDNYKEVDLRNIERVGFIAELKNISQVNLLYSTKRIIIRLPNGTLIRDHAPGIPSEDTIIYPEGFGYIKMGDIPAKDLLRNLDNNKNFFLSFEPIIEYNNEENWPKEKINFNSVMDCSNDWNWNINKIFKPQCNERKINDFN